MRHCMVAIVLVASLVGCKGDSRSPLADVARACHDHEMSCPRPILGVRNLREELGYYRDKLGFKVDWEWGEPADFASVSRDHTILFSAETEQGTSSGGSWLMVFTSDVDKLHDEFRRKGAIIRMPPQNMPWGVREMRVDDPDGNVIRFGTGIDHDD